MLREIKTITFGGVNCYLLTIDTGFVLIDMGFSKNRVDVEKELESVGCKPRTPKLILLTHGDFDHSGNCAYFREKYSAKVVMHSGDNGMVKHGDLFYNRNVNFLIRILGKMMLFDISLGLKKNGRFTPDLYVEDGHDLSEFGFDARGIHFLEHSAVLSGF